MTFNFAPWAIDGARSSAGLARLASYASGGGQSGIVQPADLRVTSLATPGNGLRIGAGGATVLNGYLTNPDEAYVVSNPAPHTVTADVMPSAKPGTSYYLVCIVVGDPEFDQSEHPFMPSGDLDPLDAPDFEYVRVVVIPCSAGTMRFEDLGLNYPAYALARLEVPGNTTTIQNNMITDLRQLGKPRESTRLLVAQPQGPVQSGGRFFGPGYLTVGDWIPQIRIPDWCTYIEAVGRIDGIVHIDPYVAGNSRLRIGNVAGAPTMYERPDGLAIGERISLVGAWGADVTQWAGTVQPFYMELNKTSGDGYLEAYSDSTVSLDIRFSERPI